MGCFGGDEPTKTTTTTGTTNSTKTLDPALYGAAMSNINYLNNAQRTGYTPYAGPTTAGLSADEKGAGDIIRATASGANPYTGMLESAFGSAASGPAYQVGTGTVVDNVGGHSTQDYMNPYVQGVLDPALREIEKQKQQNINQLGLQRALGGAFGDARTGFEASDLRTQAANSAADTTMRGYADAFNTAMALKSSDLARILQGDITNANLGETAMSRRIVGGQALQGLDKYNTGRSLDLASALGQYGAIERGIQQHEIDAAMAEYAKKYQYPLDVSRILAGAVAGVAPSLTSTSGTSTETAQTTEPNNSGWQALGAIGGSLISSIGGPIGTAIGGQIGKSLVE